MQLFISSQFDIKQTILTIHDERIIFQCHKVLRYKPGSSIQLQHTTTRYTLELTKITRDILEGTILSHKVLPEHDSQVSLIIALPNRRDKAEFMIQKLSEIGIQALYFWPAQRSLLRTIDPKRQARLEKIALEAAEQSFRNSLMSIKFLDKLDKNITLGQGQIIIADSEGKPSQEVLKNTPGQELCAIIGPEGGLTSQEKLLLSDTSNHISLGNTMLRMETAAIIMGRLLCNNSSPL